MAPRQHKYSERDERCARWMHELIRQIYNRAKAPNWPAWANDIRLMREQDRRSYDEIAELFRWANKHPFWKQNILSPATLRKQWDRLAIQMQADKPAPKPKITPKPRPALPAERSRPAPESEYYQALRRLGIDPKPSEPEPLANLKPAPKKEKEYTLDRTGGNCSQCGNRAQIIARFKDRSLCIDCATKSL